MAERSASDEQSLILQLDSQRYQRDGKTKRLTVRPRAVCHDERGLLFRDFASGVETLRQTVVEGVPVAMLRLADARETALYELLRRDPARRFDASALGLAVAGRFGFGAGRCAMIAAAEGPERRPLRAALARLRAIARRHGALPLGSSPGRSWRRDRFRAIRVVFADEKTLEQIPAGPTVLYGDLD